MSLAIPTVAILLVLGVILRQSVKWLRVLFIPGSVVAGFIGLTSVGCVSQFGGETLNQSVGQICATLSGWPGPLIALVFAAMMLQKPAESPHPRDESATMRVGRQGLMVWIIVLGETMVGLLATWLLVKPFYDVPNSFGMLIEIGFAGGHGTAGAMGQVFGSPQVNLPAGLDLGMLMATCGLVYGVISGVVWINIASRVGWLETDGESPRGQTTGNELAGPAEETDSVPRKKPIGFQTLPSEAIDPLLLQAVWIALAVALGFLMQSGVMAIAGLLDQWMGAGVVEGGAGVVEGGAGVVEGGASVVEGKEAADAELSKRLSAANVMDFPLFIYTMFGGWMVRRLVRATGHDDLIDSATVQRISASAMEILVVAAITSLKLSAVAELLGPFMILFVCGAIWTAICLMLISRWILPHKHWFQLALINYGMSTGTTATGFVLLRVVDPELKTKAASDYALAAPLSAPFIGGGIITIALPLLVLENVSIAWPTLVIGAVVLGLIAIGRWWSRPD